MNNKQLKKKKMGGGEDLQVITFVALSPLPKH